MPRAAYNLEFVQELNEPGNVLRHRIRTRRGEVEGFVLQYETTIDHESVPVMRYDCAHGFAHRDTLDRQGRVVATDALSATLSLKQALEVRGLDLLQNWPRYRDAFVGSIR